MVCTFPKEHACRILRKNTGYCKQLELLFLLDEEATDFRHYLVDYKKDNHHFEFWVTTRSDDTMSEGFIVDIQQCAKENSEEYAISYPDGYQYDVRKGGNCEISFSYVADKCKRNIYDFCNINLINHDWISYLR